MKMDYFRKLKSTCCIFKEHVKLEKYGYGFLFLCSTSLLFPLKSYSLEVSNVQVQQEKNIKGTIKDSSGEPIIGANVVVKGSSIGTITDFNGEFSISVPENSVLLISYIGYQQTEVIVSGRSNYDVVLKEDSELLDEVVVIGYGAVKKADLSGSVSTMGSKLVKDRKTMNLSNALSGAMSGVSVSRQGGEPGALGDILIRGVTTIGNTSPLVIIDGVEGDLDAVNPNDVENISVLKDAASASIYGSKAAAGVIIITTKRAKGEKVSVSYDFEYGIETAPVHPEFVGAVDYMKMENEGVWNDAGNGDDRFPVYSEDLINNYESLHLENPDKYPMTDWYNEVMHKTASSQMHSVGISVNADKIKSYNSFGYNKVGALYNNFNKKRYTFRSNNDINFNKYLSATVNFSFRRVEDDKPRTDPSDIFFAIMTARPIDAAFWSDGRYAPGRDGGSIVSSIDRSGFRDRSYSDVDGKFALNFKPIKDLTISAVFAPHFQWEKNKTFTKKVEFTSAEDPNEVIHVLPAETSLSESRNDAMRFTSQFVANYIKTFNKKHNLNAMVGYEAYYGFNESLSASRGQYQLTEYPYLNLGNKDFQGTSGSASESARRSYFGRVMYNYKQKYYVQINTRIDGSSNFHKDHRWGTFPSASAAWTISEEKFMLSTKNWLDNLKFRLSYGLLGNDRISAFAYMAKLGFGDVVFTNNGEANIYQYAAATNYPIEDITWEKTKTFDVGVDAAFLGNRLRFSFDYYIKKTTDMLLNVQIPTFIGYGNPVNNAGAMKTKGFDFEINWNDNIGEFNYSLGFNLSDSKSIMQDMAGTEMIGNYIKAEGTEFEEFYGYVSEGIYQTQEEVDNSAKLSNAVRPGDIKYKDISGPDGVPDGIISAAYDRVPLGGSLPRFLYGGNVYMEYKGFDLSFAFQGIGKRNSYMSPYMIAPLQNHTGGIQEYAKGKYWSHYNTPEQNEKALYPLISEKDQSLNYCNSDFWIFNGAYFRMKNITLGYNFPIELVKKIGLQGLRIYAATNDPFSISHYPEGWAPETSDRSMHYPYTVSYLFGLNVKF